MASQKRHSYLIKLTKACTPDTCTCANKMENVSKILFEENTNNLGERWRTVSIDPSKHITYIAWSGPVDMDPCHPGVSWDAPAEIVGSVDEGEGNASLASNLD